MADTGNVTLVGAGPGDPGLLTLAGKAAIEQADVILYDRLIGDGVMAMLPAGAMKIAVGKRKGDHPVPQAEINRLIAEYALAGKSVVRLKGGDPFLFGRGAEELKALVENHIPFRVVPGVTSAIAAPAYAGIPVTHRDYASSLHILTGHGKDGQPPDIPYRQLAGLNGTLVFLMGLSTIEPICRSLVEAGMPPDTPAASIENGTRQNQRRLSGTLRTLPELAESHAPASPALLVVGAVCELADSLDWTAALPLRGRRILVAGSAKTGGRLAQTLRRRGCAVDEYAGIAMTRIPAPPSLWPGIGRYGWIVLTSRFGVDCFFDSLFEAGLDIRSLAGARFAVVGDKTGLALRQRGIRPDLVPRDFNGPALGESLAAVARPNDRILLYRAEAGGAELPGALRKAGLDFDDIAAYRTAGNALSPAMIEALRDGAYDAVTFTSASAAAAFAEAAPEGCALPAFCIGGMTAAAAEKHGMKTLIAGAATIESLADKVTKELGNA